MANVTHMTQQDDQLPAPEYPAVVAEIGAIPDVVLLGLVDGANSSELEIAITLDVSGVVVSRRLIGAVRFFEEMAAMLAEQGQPGLAEHLAKGTADLLREEFSKDDGSNDTRRRRHVHLTDAQVITSANAMPIPSNLWRGRLAHVSGWSLGTLDVSRG